MNEPNRMDRFWFESGGVRLLAVKRGAREVIVVLHGGVASHVAVSPIVVQIPERIRVMAPDIRGSGRS